MFGSAEPNGCDANPKTSIVTSEEHLFVLLDYPIQQAETVSLRHLCRF